jgi:hypothetical protein
MTLFHDSNWLRTYIEANMKYWSKNENIRSFQIMASSELKCVAIIGKFSTYLMKIIWKYKQLYL